MKGKSASGDLFARLAPAYGMLASPARVRDEVAALLPHLRGIGAGKILDAGCAVGLHACELARAGLRVTGIDLSKAMIEEARIRSKGLDLPVRFLRKDLREAGTIPGRPFDAVLCLGNTLASVVSRVDRARSLRAFHDALRSGGLLLLQLRDLSSIRRKGHLFPVRSFERKGEEWILLRRQYPDPRGVRFRSSLLYRAREGGAWELSESEIVQPVLAGPVWREDLTRAGFSRILFASDLSGTPWKPGSADRIIIARRG